ncbi:ankyrin repeat domain-containing protein [Isoalcanivorax indicus]|uniref:ankyrin repeat domain-containing protein n=1 Tax=Isoalcanivorax indicus TaxID=2202653 RepID=UPI001B885E98|nr:ankyrin repeat domain-containing protein [Isoalcanivorax indicus]
MAKRSKQRMTLEEILQATSDSLFPAERGKRLVAVNSTDVDGDTPLHVMAVRGDSFACQALVDAGADVNAIGDMGQTPLHVAISRGYIEIVELLLRAGARTDIQSEFGETQLEKAKKKGGEIARLVARAEAT